jgi:hypothetical protein
MLGRARSGVELGRPDALPARPADAPRELGRQLPLLRVRLALIRGEWRRADRLIKRLPRPVRYRPRQMVWMALAWRGLGRVEEARYALQLVLRDPRLHDNRLKVEAMLDLSEVQLQRGQPHAAFEAARSAAVLARGLGSTALLARAEQQLARSKIALER